MFKRPTLEVRASAPLSGAKAKQLQQRLSFWYPALSPEDRVALVPNRSPTLNLEKTGTSTVIYCQPYPKQPLFFDPTGKGDVIMPTVYTLWRYPNMVRKIVIPCEIYGRLLSGADIMVPGLLPPSELNGVVLGEIVAIHAMGNDRAIAVGTMLLDMDGISKSQGKGKCTKTYHVYGDALWRYGDQCIPNEGFGRDFVSAVARDQRCMPDVTFSAEETTSEINDEIPLEELLLEPESIVDMKSAIESSLDKLLRSAAGEATLQPIALSVLQAAITGIDARFDIKSTPYRTWDLLFRAYAKKGAIKMKDIQGNPSIVSIKLQQIDRNRDGASNSETDAFDGSIDDADIEFMDEMIVRAFVAALKFRIVDSDLPMQWPAVISHIRTSTANSLDIKSSSFKTFKKLHREFAKRGLIQVKERKDSTILVSVNRAHPELFVAPDEVPTAAAKKPASKSKDLSKITVETKFEPNKRVRFLFSNVPSKTLFTMSDARSKLLEYVQREGLRRERGQIQLDPVLAGALFHGVDDASFPSTMPSKDLLVQYEKQFIRYTAIAFSDEDAPVFTKGAPPCIEIVVEKVGQKLRTRIKNLEPFGISPSELAQLGQKRFASATSIKPLPNKNVRQKLYEVLIQGKVDKELTALLKTEMKVPVHLINVIRKDVKIKA